MSGTVSTVDNCCKVEVAANSVSSTTRPAREIEFPTEVLPRPHLVWS